MLQNKGRDEMIRGIPHRKVSRVLRGSSRTSRVLWLMPGIWHLLHGLGVLMLIPATLILVHSSSAKAPHPRTTMLTNRRKKTCPPPHTHVPNRKAGG